MAVKHCCCCGKQIVKSYCPNENDKNATTAVGAKAGFGGEFFCGHCAKDLDEDGLFPEERASIH